MERRHGLADELLEKIDKEFHDTVAEQELFFKEYPHLRPEKTEDQMRELCEGDETLEALLDEMIEYMHRYTVDVCEWNKMDRMVGTKDYDPREFVKLDTQRTILHDAMIDSVRIFSRNLAKAGKDNSWVESIDSKGRVGYAAFALKCTYAEIIRRHHQEESNENA